MGVPTIPLSELYGHTVGFIEAHEGKVHLRAGVTALAHDATQSRWRIFSSSGDIEADAVILALPFEGAQKLLPEIQPHNENAVTLERQLSHFEHSPITGIHLWFEQPVTDLPHAALLDTTIQWMYNKSLLQPETRGQQAGQYLELVVSASKSLVEKSRQEILDLALDELAQFFPRVRQSKLLKATVVKEVRATFCVTPGLDAYRPTAATAWPGLFLAGDWTHTSWPSTMEGAVRSGLLAAEALTQQAGQPQTFLQPDIVPEGFMKFFR